MDDPAIDPTPSPRRPIDALPASLPAVAELTVVILRRRVGVLLAIAFLFGIPSALLSVASSLPLADVIDRVVPPGATTADIALTEAQVRELTGAILLALAGGLAAGVVGALTALATVRIVADDLDARPVDGRAAAHRALVRALPAVGVALLTTLALLALWIPGGTVALTLIAGNGPATTGGPLVFAALVIVVALVAATVMLSVRWAFAGVAIALGDAGPRGALRTAWTMSAGHGIRIVALLVGTAIVTGVVGSIITGVLDLVLTAPVADQAALVDVVDVVVSTIVGIVLAPVTPAILTVLWFDIAARRRMAAS